MTPVTVILMGAVLATIIIHVIDFKKLNDRIEKLEAKNRQE